jgi:hypothetical protein
LSWSVMAMDFKRSRGFSSVAVSIGPLQFCQLELQSILLLRIFPPAFHSR